MIILRLKCNIYKLLIFLESKSTPHSIINNQHLTEVYCKMQPPVCSMGCKEFCNRYIPGFQRKQIFNAFRKLQNAIEQNCKIVELINLRIVKKSNGKFETFPLYRLVINNKSKKVCRLFFMNTLGITNDRLNAILVSENYSWYCFKETALKASRPQPVTVVPMKSSNFITNSLNLLEKDYNLFEDENDSNTSTVSGIEMERVLNYIKGVPRVISSHKISGGKRRLFETTIDVVSMHKMYCKKCNASNAVHPPCTIKQFKKIYNMYMKTFS